MYICKDATYPKINKKSEEINKWFWILIGFKKVILIFDFEISRIEIQMKM